MRAKNKLLCLAVLKGILNRKDIFVTKVFVIHVSEFLIVNNSVNFR